MVELKTDRAFGAKCHEGWSACWNWVLSCWRNVKGGSGIEVTGKEYGVPVIKAKIRAGANCSVVEMDGEIVISFVIGTPGVS